MAAIDWIRSRSSYISATEYFRPLSEINRNVIFIELQDVLIRSKNGKVKADERSWIFYSDDTPTYLDELVDWEIVIYDIRKSLSIITPVRSTQSTIAPEFEHLIEQVLSELNRDVFVFVCQTSDIVSEFIRFTGVYPSEASFTVGKGGYSPSDVFPAQPEFHFPPIQAMYITIGQPNSGRKEFFQNVTNIVEVEKKGNWQKKIGDYAYRGWTVILQGMNQSREDRLPAIHIARSMNIPVYLLWFTRRDLDRSEYPKIVYERYIQSFQEPSGDEGCVIRIN